MKCRSLWKLNSRFFMVVWPTLWKNRYFFQEHSESLIETNRLSHKITKIASSSTVFKKCETCISKIYWSFLRESILRPCLPLSFFKTQFQSACNKSIRNAILDVSTLICCPQSLLAIILDTHININSLRPCIHAFSRPSFLSLVGIQVINMINYKLSLFRMAVIKAGAN